MRKLVAGLFILLIGGVGGYFGLSYWAQHAALREVDAVLENWRASAGSATRGPVEFDLLTRTLKVADIVLEAKTTPPSKMTIRQVVASGIDPTGKASRIDILDWELTGPLPGLLSAAISQKAPRITLEGYVGPPPRSLKAASGIDLMRLWLEQFAATTARTITIPKLEAVISPSGGGLPGMLSRTEYAYSNIVMRDVQKGRIAEATADNAVLAGGITGHPLGKFTGEVGKMSITDVDVGPMLALLDPAKAKDDGYQRVYGKISVGPYLVRFDSGATMRIDSMTAEDLGLRPSKLSLNDMAFLSDVSASPVPPSPIQMGILIDKVAGLYEGVRVGKLEMQGLSFDMLPGSGIKLANVRMNGLENGRLAEFDMKGFDVQGPRNETFSLGRFGLKGFDIANLLRTSARLGLAGPQPPSTDELVGMLALLEGIELEDMSVPDPKTGRKVRIDSFAASWGQFVGVFPTLARISAKMAGPVSLADPEPLRALAESGVSTLTVDYDVGAAWTANTQTFALGPARLDIGSMFSVSVTASLGGVQRGVFSTDPGKVMQAAALVEAGPIELSVRDLGVIDLLAAQLAKQKGQPSDEGRAILLETLAQSTPAHPDMRVLLNAIGRFVQSKGETLTIKLVPKGRVDMMRLIEASNRGGDAAATLLADFTIEATVGR